MKKAAIILAAGKGERLRPLTETRPKPLMPILGEPLICRHLRLISEYYNPDRIVAIVSYMKDMVASEIQRCGFHDTIVVDQGGEKGTGHAISLGMNTVDADEYLIVYGDVYTSPENYSRIASTRPPAILAASVERPWEYGVLEVKDGYLKNLVEKPPKGEEPSNLILAGIMKVRSEHKAYFDGLKPSLRGEYEATDALLSISRSEDVIVVEAVGDWIDIGRPWDLLEANMRALSEIENRIMGEIHPTAVIEGTVFVAPGAYVGPYTVISGNAFIGPGARIGPHSYLRGRVVVLEGARIGHATEVKGSLIMEHARARHFNYVGDSILGEHVNLGAGTITANLRFDDKTIRVTVKGRRVDTGRRKLGAIMGGYSKTGINVSLMPGVKVGSRAIVYPGCVVDRDVEPGGVYKCR